MAQSHLPVPFPRPIPLLIVVVTHLSLSLLLYLLLLPLSPLGLLVTHKETSLLIKTFSLPCLVCSLIKHAHLGCLFKTIFRMIKGTRQKKTETEVKRRKAGRKQDEEREKNHVG